MTRHQRHSGELVPQISVVMPIHNAATYIYDAISSLICQTWVDWELIAVLDRCSDSSEDILRSIDDARIHVEHLLEGRAGISAALNHGIAAARGHLIARLDADDVALPTRLSAQFAEFESRPSLVLLGGSAELIDREGRPLGVRNVRTGDSAIRKRLIWRNQFIHPSVMMRQEAVTGAGLYNERLNRLQDYDLWLRIAMIGEVDNLSVPIVRYRRHGGQHSWGTTLWGENTAALYASRRRLAHNVGSPFPAVILHTAWIAGQLARETRLRLGIGSGFG